MTPKEKAIELISRFLTYSNQFYDNDIRDAKQCALIAVAEIISQWEYIDTYLADMNKNLNLKFWEGVKQEIEKL